MSELFIVFALEAKDGKEEELRHDLSRLVEPSRNEEGNIRYDLLEDVSAPGHFVLVEEWSSAEARNKHHEHGAHIKHFHENGLKNVATTEFGRLLKRIL